MDDLTGFPTGYRQLFLGQNSEPATNELRLVPLEGAAQGPVVVPDESVGIPGREVRPLTDADAIIVCWKSYVSYAVRNETYAMNDGAPPPESMLIERASSEWKKFVSSATWATDDYPGRLRFFEGFCEHHVIDVASTDAPGITREPVAPNTLMEATIRVFNRA